jgi:hypothetical protein
MNEGSIMQYVMGLMIGIGLSAACGFRVFVPLLVMSIATLSGHMTLAPGFEWIGSYPALLAFAVATLLEVGAYFIPWLDNVLDAAASPAAVVAAAVLTASQLGDASPLVRWSLAIIAGGGVCGVIQTGTVAARAVSTGTTGGVGNHVLSSTELGLSLLMSILAIVVPVLAALVVVGLLCVSVWKITQWMMRRKPSVTAAAIPES